MRTVLSLFSGIGLGDLGFEVAGVETVGQVEIDTWNRRVLEHHWPGLWRRGDITEVTDDELRRFRGCWCVAGGFPCQDISVAGKGAGITGARSGLWTHMLRAVRVCRPVWTLIENVPALRTRGIDVVLNDMEGLGYSCRPVVVGAAAVGAPHRRDRVWIVCRNMGDSLAVRAGNQPGADRGQGREPARPSEPTSVRQAHGPDGAGRIEPADCDQRGMADTNGIGGGQPQHTERAQPWSDAGDHAGGRGGREPAELGHPQPAVLEGHWANAGGTQEPQPWHPGAFWPAGPGRPQHDWECPRLTQPGLGGTTDDRTRRREVARWRKAALRGLGNAQVPLVVAAVVRAMIRIEESGQ